MSFRKTIKKKEIYAYKNDIMSLIVEGYHATGIARKLKANGCLLGTQTIRRYAKLFADECGTDINKNQKGPSTKNKKMFENVIIPSGG